MTPAEKFAAAKQAEQHHQMPRKPRSLTIPFTGNRLADLRHTLNLTAKEAADGVGMQYQVYRRAESGMNLYLTTAYAIARFYGRTVEELWPNEMPASPANCNPEEPT